MHSIEKGSQTAKDGFRNEEDIIIKFNNWLQDKDAQLWLKIMKYNISDIKNVEAIKISGFKTDVQIQVTIFFLKRY